MKLNELNSVLMALNSIKVSGLEDCAKMAASLRFLQEMMFEIENDNIVYMKDEPTSE